MAEKKTEKKEEKKIDRVYVIPIRKLSKRASRWKKAKKAILEIRRFMHRHMKSDNLKIGKELNELIWERGGQTVPAKVEVHAVKEEGIVKINLVGCALPGSEKKEEKKEEKKDEKKEGNNKTKTIEKKETAHENKVST